MPLPLQTMWKQERTKLHYHKLHVIPVSKLMVISCTPHLCWGRQTSDLEGAWNPEEYGERGSDEAVTGSVS